MLCVEILENAFTEVTTFFVSDVMSVLLNMHKNE